MNAAARHHAPMPELPEVETTRRGLAPHLQGRRIAQVTLYRDSLRWPIPPELPGLLHLQAVTDIRRRAKYLLLDTDRGSALWHLGMSGSLRVLPGDTPLRAHDHVDLCLDNGQVLRLNDPRRFGAVLWQPAGTTHELLAGLGPEPLSDAFDGDYLYQRSRGRKTAVKALVMDQAVVVGVGNIYANESLFAAGIDPRRPAASLSPEECERLVAEIKGVLERAIRQGGTTLKDFTRADGRPGYFVQELQVYGRARQACVRCGHPLEELRQGQRTTVYCPMCQR